MILDPRFKTRMKVILLKEIPKLGKTGEVKHVADGYARNFLIPFGYVELATKPALRGLTRKQAELSGRITKEQAQYQAVAEKLRQTPLRFTLNVGEKGQAFGSVSAQDIARELSKQGMKIEKQWIELEQGIKTTGEHIIPLRFPHQISAEVKVIVEAEMVNPKL